MSSATRVRIAALDSIWAGEMMAVSAMGTQVLLVNLGGTLHAYLDRCAHKGVQLSQGRLEGCVLTCWAHEWQYDAATGEGINPRGIRLRALPVEVEGNDVFVDVGDGQ